MAFKLILERLAGLVIVALIVSYFLAPQAVAGAIWDTANAILNHWTN